MQPQAKDDAGNALPREALLTFPDRVKFLVVEDDFTLQSIWENIILIVDPRAVIRWARSEEGAEKLIEDRLKLRDEFDFVIADVLLAGEKNGVDLWRKFKNTDMIFLFTSAITERRWAQMIGTDITFVEEESPVFIRKPLAIKECIAILDRLMSEEKSKT